MLVSKELLDGNYVSNLIALESHFPELYQMIQDYKEERYFLVYDAEGNYNIYDNEEGKNVYPESPLEFCAKSLSEYQQKPIYFSKAYGGVSGVTAQVNPIHSKVMTELATVKIAQKILCQDMVEFPEQIKNMLFVGIGAGHDLEYILKNKDISNVCILEKNIDFFYASLFLIDWAGIFEFFKENNRNLTIILDSDENYLCANFYDVIVSYGHHSANAMFIYSSVMSEHYETLLEKVSDFIRGRLLAGFGFYDDARLGIAATVSNVGSGIPLYVKDTGQEGIKQYEDCPVFIIGAGPSLDQDIAFIKAYQEKAIIISCGSGIKPLEKHGIKPDFHFECERTAFTYHWLDQVDREFFKGIDFIGLNLIYPEVYDLFDRAGMMAKSSETGSFLLAKSLEDLCGEASLPFHTHVNPTVVHMGVGVTPFLGFRKLYLFGVDMGYKDPEQHHSADSSYSDLKEDKKKAYTPKNSRPVDPNFSESEVFSDDSYLGFKMFVEGIVAANKDTFSSYQCFNCSDGAQIKGAEPLQNRDFLVDAEKLDKQKIKDYVMDTCFDSDVCHEVKGLLDQRLEEDIAIIVKACNYMSEYFSVEVSSLKEADGMLDSAVLKLFHSDDFFTDDKAYLLSLFSGSMLYAFSSLTNIIYFRTSNHEKSLECVNKAFSMLSQFFLDVAEDFENNHSVNDDLSLYNYFE